MRRTAAVEMTQTSGRNALTLLMGRRRGGSLPRGVAAAADGRNSASFISSVYFYLFSPLFFFRAS